MNLVTIKDRIVSEISALVNEGAKIIKIETAEQYENVKSFGNSAYKKAKALEEERLETTKPLRDEVAEINAVYGDAVGKLDAVVKNIKNVISEYDKEQERKRIEAQRIADEAARKERERIEAEARAQREKEDAERRKAEEARAAAEDARLAAEQAEGEERKRLEAEAAAAEKAAEKADSKADSWAGKADMKESIAETVVAPIVAPEASKGVTTVKSYKGEITDKAAFVKWCTETEVFDGLSLLAVNETALNKIIQSVKGKVKIAGVQIVESESLRMK